MAEDDGVEEMDLVEESTVGEGSSYRFGRYYCPKGGHYTPFFVAKSDRSTVVRCPICGASLGRKRVPSEAIIYDEELADMVSKGMHPLSVLRKAQEKGYIPEGISIDELYSEIRNREMEDTPVIEGDDEPERKEARREDKGDREEGEESVNRTPLDKLFVRPKTPCEVLEEVLSEFNLKKEFVTAMVRRCHRSGGLHPVELLHYLTAMKSGVKTQGEAQFIAEEYAAALREEMEKAKRLNMPYPSIGITEPGVITSAAANPSVTRLLQILPPNNYGQQVQLPTYQQGYGYTPPRQPPPRPQPPPATGQQDLSSLIQGIAALIQSLNKNQSGSEAQLYVQIMQMMQRQQQELMQLLLSQVQQQTASLAKELGQGLQELAKSFNDSIKQIRESVKQQAQQKSVDPDLLYKAAKAEAEKEYLQQLLQLTQKESEQLKKSLSELEKKVYEAIMTSSRAPSDFSRDDAKLAAVALQQLAALGNRFVDVLDKRQPVKIIVEALPMLMQQTGSAGSIEKYKEVETTKEEEILTELEKLGLVEEAG